MNRDQISFLLKLPIEGNQCVTLTSKDPLNNG